MKELKKIIIWCDEADKKGKFYSNFYGGILTTNQHYEEVIARIAKVCLDNNLHKELKWTKVTSQYLDKYINVIDELFHLLKEGKVKLRVMFRQNALVPTHLDEAQKRDEYFILYYHFLKYAFGLEYANNSGKAVSLSVFFDYLPDTIAKKEIFKDYIKGLSKDKKFRDAKIVIKRDEITEIRSHDHVMVQVLDIVLGGICARLNEKFNEVPPGSKVRGKKTIAKEKLYKHINRRIREIYPNFNIGVSTGRKELEDVWEHPYRHWCFKPREFEIDSTLYK